MDFASERSVKRALRWLLSAPKPAPNRLLFMVPDDAGLTELDPQPTEPRGRTAAQDRSSLDAVAHAAVRLAALGPRLADLARATEEQANAQARTAEQIAGATSQLAATLVRVVGELEVSADNVHQSMRDIVRIAEQTRLISLNASIEASRAGEHGRAFGVVAEEVKRLADETRQSTHRIEERVSAIHGSVQNVTTIVGTGDESRRTEAAVTMDAVDRQVRSMAGTAGSQRDGAKALHAYSDQANHLAEELLLAVGRMRFAIHEHAAADVAQHVAWVTDSLHDRAALEDKLHQWLRADPCFELLYVTDASGRQIVSNITRREGETWSDEQGYGRDWADRPWFREALRQDGAVEVSDIYRSTATGDFCFTVSVAVRDPAGGAIRAVLAADVNFQTLVNAQAARRTASAPRRRTAFPDSPTASLAWRRSA